MSLLDIEQLEKNSDINLFIYTLKKNLKIQNGITGFDTQFHAIKGAFDTNPHSTISKEDIFRQLVLIDSLYSTNVVRMRQFGIEEIAEDIWLMCDDGKGNHTITTLSQKIDITKPLPQVITTLFTNKYGYIQGKQSDSAASLISKYFHFVSIVCPQNDWGFPIYDTIVANLLNDMQRFLQIPRTPAKYFKSPKNLDINKYIDGLKCIVLELSKFDSQMWNDKIRLKFEMLDYYLWHIGKCGKKNYNLLLTKQEMLAYTQTSTLPQRIHNWEQIYNFIK